MKVYISGKIGEMAISEATRQKFARAEKLLKERGHEVINPASEDWQDALAESCEERKGKPSYTDTRQVDTERKGEPSYADVLLVDLCAIDTRCDAVYMLPDWYRSPGATAEYYFAAAIGKKIFHSTRGLAEDALIRKFYALIEEGELVKGTRSELSARIEKYIDRHLDEVYIPFEP